ncbi:MAG: hypothetical protein ACUVX8_01660 [Candidatus Zipacnadales bacterium]
MSETTPTAEPRLRPSYSPVTQVLLGIAIFTCGVSVGTGTMIIFGRNWLIHQAFRPPDPPETARSLTNGLDLSPEKRVEVQAAIERYLQAAIARREEIIRERREQLETLQAELERILEPKQARLLRQRMERFPPFSRSRSRADRGRYNGAPYGHTHLSSSRFPTDAKTFSAPPAETPSR